MPENPFPTSPKPAIAELLKVPIRYNLAKGSTMDDPQFVLVNEKQEEATEKIESEFGHTRDELIAMIGKAYPEFVQFVKEFDEAKRNYLAATAQLQRVHDIIVGGSGANHGEIGEDAGTLRARFNKSLDVLKTIAHGNHEAAQIRFIAGRYLDANERLGVLSDSLTLLVNENTDRQKS